MSTKSLQEEEEEGGEETAGRGGGEETREGHHLVCVKALGFYGGKALVKNSIRNEKFSVITQILENSSGRSKETWL